VSGVSGVSGLHSDIVSDVVIGVVRE
jgi:hypothetical protein